MSRLLGLVTAIEDAEVAELQAMEGAPIRVESWNNEATRDTIRHYAHGIGDANPLWCEPQYATSSPFGRLLAPPTFLYSVFDGAIGSGLPGVQPIYAGTRWEFLRRVGRGDEIAPDARFGRVRRLSGRTAADMVIQEADTTYRVEGRDVARAVAATFRVPRRGAEGGLTYEHREEYEYSELEVAQIRRDVFAEYRRGQQPLDIASVHSGLVIPEVVKGPIDRITMTAYYAGCIGSPGYKACELAWEYRRRAEQEPDLLPDNYDPSYYAETVLPSIGHQDTDVARQIGMPNAYDNGPQRCGWFGSAVTNWMGDRAFLHRLEVRLRRPDIFGDTVWIGGVVSDVERQDGTGVISLELRARNQLGDEVATGTAEVLTSIDPDGPHVESP